MTDQSPLARARAMFRLEALPADRLRQAAQAVDDELTETLDESLLRLYGYLAATSGTDTSAMQVRAAWVVTTHEAEVADPSTIRYRVGGPGEADARDEVHLAAIRRAAARLGNDVHVSVYERLAEQEGPSPLVTSGALGLATEMLRLNSVGQFAELLSLARRRGERPASAPLFESVKVALDRPLGGAATWQGPDYMALVTGVDPDSWWINIVDLQFTAAELTGSRVFWKLPQVGTVVARLRGTDSRVRPSDQAYYLVALDVHNPGSQGPGRAAEVAAYIRYEARRRAVAELFLGELWGDQT